MSEGNAVYSVYNLLRSSDILWDDKFTGTAQRITLSHVWAYQLISSKAFARIFKPGHTYTLSYTVKVIEPAPGTYLREDRYGVTLYSPSGMHGIKDTLMYHNNPSAGDTFRMSGTFTATDDFPGDARILAYSDLSRDSSNNMQIGIVEIDDLMIVEGSTPAAWAPAEGETLTADGGGGTMTEPTNFVITQPDETATYTVKAMVNDDGGHTDVVGSYLDGNIKLSATTSFHIGITIKPDKNIPSRRVWAWIVYRDDAGAENFANSSAISYVIPAGVWTRLEWTVTVPAGMTVTGACLSFNRLADETKFQVTNFVIYPLTGGRIVRARGATALVSVNDGAKGDTGISVTLTVDEWYLSTSSGSLSGGSWSDKRQAWASGKYYWRRIKTTYSDGRTSYTPSNNGYYDAVITDAVAKANDAYSIADGKNAIYYSDTAPAGNDYAVNDIWFDTKNDNAMHYWDGSRWLRKQFGTTAVKDGAILADKLAVNSVTSDKILAGAINADKIAANAVSLGNLDSTVVTSNILGASVNNLSTWHGTIAFISAATMTYGDDYMTSFSYTGVANWEVAYYIVNGLCNDEQYTVSFEFDAPNKLVCNAGYIPFCIFTEAGLSSRTTSFKSGDLATIQILPTAGNHRYSVSFTAKSTVIMAFNFGQLADGVQMAFSVGKFKIESGSADTGWVVPRGLYLDNDELRINADSIRTGTLDAINITGSTITGGTIRGTTISGNTITGGTISGTTISGNTITGGTITGSVITGGTINGAVINGGTGDFTGDINATSITAKQKYRIYDTFSNGTKTVELASMSGTYDAPTLLIGDGFGNVTVALNGSAGQSEPAFNVGINGTGTLICGAAEATNFIGNWNGLSADFSTYSRDATWIPVFNNMKMQHTLPNDIANLAGCARVCRTKWAKTLDCGLRHGIVLISNYRAYLFWYSGVSPNMAISYKAIYGGDSNTTFTELNKTGTGNCWRITVEKNSRITVIGDY